MSRRDTVPTQQAGEYLVAAELARAGATCATFAGTFVTLTSSHQVLGDTSRFK